MNLIKKSLIGFCECGTATRFFDSEFSVYVCSQECQETIWRVNLSSNPILSQEHRRKFYPNEIQNEERLIHLSNYTKAILIVVHDALDYLEQCVKSIKAVTSNFKLYIWDNASQTVIPEAIRSEVNQGFIIPNNRLAEMVTEDVIICLNSVTVVSEGWDNALCSFLDLGYSQVGCLGGLLEEDFTGSYTAFGEDIDYVLGWCFAIKRSTYEKYGLFSEDLQQAYFEDVDLSLRLRANGEKIYALYSPFVHHYGGKTISVIDVDFYNKIKFNHGIVKNKWKEVFTKRNFERNPRIWSSPGKNIKET